MIKLGAGGEKNEKDLTSEVFDEYMIKNENIEEGIASEKADDESSILENAAEPKKKKKRKNLKLMMKKSKKLKK